MKQKLTPLGIVTGVFLTLAALSIVGLTVIYTGGYNVAATEGHSPFGRWLASTTMENSVEVRAADIAEPRFTQAMIASGGGKYKAMCAQCHGGPGMEPAEWSQRMLPRPPQLAGEATEWRPREIFWIVKNGIKMSAMPAFGPTHDDGTLWAITAFAKQLPKMTTEQYAAISADEEHGAGGHHGDKEAAVEPKGHGEPGHGH